MIPINGYIQIKRVEWGNFCSQAVNDFEVVASDYKGFDINPGDMVVVDYEHVIKTTVWHQEVLFVRGENVFAVFKKSDCPDAAEKYGLE